MEMISCLKKYRFYHNYIKLLPYIYNLINKGNEMVQNYYGNDFIHLKCQIKLADSF